jgi:two-component system nitrate/nitrite response regulator NarL
MSSELENPPKFSFYDWSALAELSEKGRIRVLVADATRMASELLASVLQADSQINVVAAVASSVENSEIINRHRPEVILLSANLEGNNTRGLEFASELQTAKPEIRIVMLLETSSSDAVVKAFRAGASGVFSREGSLHSLCKCIHSVYEGQVWASSEEIRYVLEALATKPRPGLDKDRLSSLTRREREVVDLATGGLTNKEIANNLEISEHTVKNYMFSIFEKLGVSSRVELSLGSRSNVVPLRPDGPDESAIKWLHELAEEGLASAQFLLGEIYHQGRRVPQDRVEAYHWYLLAQQCDLSEAGDAARKKLAKEMSPLQVAESERRVLIWLDRKRKSARRA